MKEITEKLQKVIEKITYESLKEGSIKETTEKELETILFEMYWDLFYENLKEQTIICSGILIFLLKILIFLFLVYQILDNIGKYIDSKRIRFRSPIYTDEEDF